MLSLATTLLNDANLGIPKAPVGILSLLLAIAAFALALRDGSAVVSVSLLAKGLIDTAVAAASTKSGAKIGLVFGLAVLALGVGIALITVWRARRGAPARSG